MAKWIGKSDETWALQMMVEAHAQALAVIASRRPEKPAPVETFNEELLNTL